MHDFPMPTHLQSMADRIREALGNDTPYDASRRLRERGVQISAQSIYEWLKGSEVKEDNLEQLAAEYGTTCAWLRYGAGDARAPSDVATEGGQLMERLPDEVRQETLDFIGYKLSRPDVQIAEETRASYLRFTEAVRADLARKTGGS